MHPPVARECSQVDKRSLTQAARVGLLARVRSQVRLQAGGVAEAGVAVGARVGLLARVGPLVRPAERAGMEGRLSVINS